MSGNNEKYPHCPQCGGGFFATDGEEEDAWYECEGCGWKGPQYLTYRVSPNMFDLYESTMIALVGKDIEITVRQGGWRVIGQIVEQHGVHFYVEDGCGSKAHLTPWTVADILIVEEGKVQITLKQ